MQVGFGRVDITPPLGIELADADATLIDRPLDAGALFTKAWAGMRTRRPIGSTDDSSSDRTRAIE